MILLLLILYILVVLISCGSVIKMYQHQDNRNCKHYPSLSQSPTNTYAYFTSTNSTSSILLIVGVHACTLQVWRSYFFPPSKPTTVRVLLIESTQSQVLRVICSPVVSTGLISIDRLQRHQVSSFFFDFFTIIYMAFTKNKGYYYRYHDS